MKSKARPERKKQGGSSRAAPCSADELAKLIAAEILTVEASGKAVLCTRAVMMKGRYPDRERDMGGRNAASIAFVIREHLIAAGFPPTEPDNMAVARAGARK